MDIPRIYKEYIAKARLACGEGNKVLYSLPNLCLTTTQFELILQHISHILGRCVSTNFNILIHYRNFAYSFKTGLI